MAIKYVPFPAIWESFLAADAYMHIGLYHGPFWEMPTISQKCPDNNLSTFKFS